MDQQTLLTVMTAFVGISAIALLIQMVMLIGIYRATRGMQENVQRLLPKIEGLIESSRQTIEDGRKQFLDISSKAKDILDASKDVLDKARVQLQRVDSVIEDATTRAHVQLERADMVIDDAMERAHHTVAVVHTGIMKPLREIQGVAAGVRTAIEFLMRRRSDPTHATSDEEMFI